MVRRGGGSFRKRFPYQPAFPRSSHHSNKGLLNERKRKSANTREFHCQLLRAWYWRRITTNKFRSSQLNTLRHVKQLKVISHIPATKAVTCYKTCWNVILYSPTHFYTSKEIITKARHTNEMCKRTSHTMVEDENNLLWNYKYVKGGY